MTAGVNAFGPWADGLDEPERRARLRSLRATVRLLTGPHGADLARLLAEAETDPSALEPGLAALDRLASIDRRIVLASYAALHRTAA